MGTDGTGGEDELTRIAKTARKLANPLAAGEGEADGELDSLEEQLGNLEEAVRGAHDGTEMEQWTFAFAMKQVTDPMRKLSDLYGLRST